MKSTDFIALSRAGDTVTVQPEGKSLRSHFA